jgi:hypothetical protein
MSSLLDDARRLLEDRPARGGSVLKSHPQGRCYYCAGDGYGDPHAPDCPWRALPQIVAALEALAEYAKDENWMGNEWMMPYQPRFGLTGDGPQLARRALEAAPTDTHLTGTTD